MRPELTEHRPLRKMTLEQWGGLDEDVEGELVDGALEEEEVPTNVHELVVAWFLVLLTRWIDPRGGEAVGSETKLAIAARRGRKPDVAVFTKQALPPGREPVVRVPPWIVVEVLSPRPRDERRDRVEKPRDYARCHARYYWVVNPTLRTLEVFELNRRRPIRNGSFRERGLPQPSPRLSRPETEVGRALAKSRRGRAPLTSRRAWEWLST